MDDNKRKEGRYGKGEKKTDEKRKSYKDTDHQDWDKEHAQDYLDSEEGQQHAAMQQQAQNLVSQPQAQPQAGGPGAASPSPLAAAAIAPGAQ